MSSSLLNIPDYGNPEDEGFYDSNDFDNNRPPPYNPEDEVNDEPDLETNEDNFYSINNQEIEDIKKGKYQDEHNSNPHEDFKKHLEEEAISEDRSKQKQFEKIKDTNNEKYQKIDNSNYHISTKRIDSIKIKDLKRLLNLYLIDVPSKDESFWEELSEQMTSNNPLNIRTSGKKLYQIGVFKTLCDLKDAYSWEFSKDGNSIYIYNDAYWVNIEINLFKEFLKITVIKLNVPEFLYIDSKFIDTIYKQLLQSDFFVNVEVTGRTLINLKNGTLQIRSDGVKLLDFHPNDFLTYQLDFEYNEDRKNYRLLDYLNYVLPDKDTQKTLQQAIGSLFIHSIKLEKVPFLYGTGANGKSVIFEILNGLLDPSLITHYSLESLTNSKGYERAELENKLINYCSDMNMNNIDFGMFKQLASGEPIQVRPIYQQPFIMKRYAKMIFNINKIDDADIEQTEGFLRRMLYIPFETTIPLDKQDKKLHEKILKDKAGVLNWIIEGIEEILKNEEIFISKRCGDFLDNFIQDSNLTARFVKEYSIKHSDSETISFQNMYDRFLKFCKNEGEKSITKTIFNREMKKLKFTPKRANSGMVWNVNFN
jgi:putative DNA primase/helicase